MEPIYQNHNYGFKPSPTQNHCLISPVNIIAFCETAQSSHHTKRHLKLQLTNIKSIVNAVLQKHPNYSKYPVALVSIVGTETDLHPCSRELYTDWLIDYMENGGPQDTQKVTTSIKHLGSKRKLKEDIAGFGVYLWPRPYLFRGQRTNDDHLVFVAYVHTNACQELAQFNQMIISNPVQVETQDLKHHQLTRNLGILLYNRLIKKLFQTPIVLANHPLGGYVSLENLDTYFQLIADTVNHQISGRTGRSKRGKKKRVKDIRKSTNPKGETKVNLNGRAVKFEQENNHPLICNQPSCYVHLQEDELVTWIYQNLSTSNIEYDAESLKNKIPCPNQHGIKDLIQILHQLIFQLYNMFDNYVCFSGDQDYKQMKRFMKDAKANSMKTFGLKGYTQPEFLEKIHKNCCHKIIAILKFENQKIISNEDILVRKAYSHISQAFHQKLAITARQAPPENLATIHKSMKTYCIRMMNQVLNFNGRLNNVHKKIMEHLEPEMNRIFTEILKMLPKPPSQNKLALVPKLQKHLILYTKDMEKVRKTFLTTTYPQRKQIHDMIVAKLIQNISSEADRKQINLILNCNFLQINESHEQNKYEFPGRESTPVSTLCFHVTPEKISVTAETAMGSKVLTSGTNNTLPYLKIRSALVKANAFRYYLETIQGGSRRSRKPVVWLKDDLAISIHMLRDLFNNLKTRTASWFNDSWKCGKILVVVPSWFDSNERKMIRSVCRGTDFIQTFILSEAPLAAYLTLDKCNFQENKNAYYAVVVSLADPYVQVRIYRKQSDIKSNSTIQLVAITQSLLPHFNAKRGLPPNYESVMGAVYEKAVNQLGDSQYDKNSRKQCAIICDSAKWVEPLKHFIRSQKDLENVLDFRHDESCNAVLHAILKLSQTPETIHTTLVDSCLDFKFPNHPETSEMHLTQAKLNENQIIMERKREVRVLCAKMRAQLEDGSVRVGVISQRLINGALSDAETTAISDSATLNDLEKQWNELAAIIEQHQFTCK